MKKYEVGDIALLTWFNLKVEIVGEKYGYYTVKYLDSAQKHIVGHKWEGHRLQLIVPTKLKNTKLYKLLNEEETT